jgi:hypothetical protein
MSRLMSVLGSSTGAFSTSDSYSVEGCDEWIMTGKKPLSTALQRCRWLYQILAACLQNNPPSLLWMLPALFPRGRSKPVASIRWSPIRVHGVPNQSNTRTNLPHISCTRHLVESIANASSCSWWSPVRISCCSFRAAFCSLPWTVKQATTFSSTYNSILPLAAANKPEHWSESASWADCAAVVPPEYRSVAATGGCRSLTDVVPRSSDLREATPAILKTWSGSLCVWGGRGGRRKPKVCPSVAADTCLPFPVSGVWHSVSLRNLKRNALLVCLQIRWDCVETKSFLDSSSSGTTASNLAYVKLRICHPASSGGGPGAIGPVQLP